MWISFPVLERDLNPSSRSLKRNIEVPTYCRRIFGISLLYDAMIFSILLDSIWLVISTSSFDLIRYAPPRQQARAEMSQA